MADMKKKIGIMGGTFDPVHNAHLVLAKQAYRQYDLNEIWMLPNGKPPHKQNTRQAGMEHRMNMLRLAIQDIPYLKLCDVEQSGTVCHYTYETLQQLNRAYPDTTFYFIMGADSLFEFDGWKEPGIISKECILLAAVRDNHPGEELKARIRVLEARYGARIHLLDTPRMDLASEEIRRLLADGKDVSCMVPAAVAAYMRRHHLYETNTQQ